jgi:regulator of sirC expression with transglutaminase-like and TPR domain
MLGVLVCLPAGRVQAAEASELRHSRLAQEACALRENRPWTKTSRSKCSEVAGLVARARKAVPRGLAPWQSLEKLNDFFFETERFQASYELDAPESLLLNGVLARRKGHCVGLATVYLILAEELGLPIHAVATPKHMFLRWDDGKFRRNIELFQKGSEVPDEDYVREQKIPKESIDRGVFLANLTRKQFLGFIYQNRGVLASQRGDFESSAKDYRRALRLNPKLAAAYYNRGNDELKQKRYREAIRDYSRSLKLYPGDPWAMKNRGLASRGLSDVAAGS